MGKGMGSTMGVAVLLLALQGTVVAQEPQACGPPDAVGSLGITGIECERCQFISGGGHERAVFYTEPTILGLRPSAPAADILQAGDVLVAIDGSLITTSAGWDRFSNLPADGTVVLRIRRDGRLRDVEVPLMQVCPSPEVAPGPAIAGRPVPPRAPRAEAVGIGRRRPPVASEAPKPVSPATVEPAGIAAVAPPVPPGSLAPHASLGFGFECTECGYDGDRWRFSEPFEVTGLAVDGPADRAGLRPGDRVVAIDGVDITTEEGGRRFARIEPGHRVTWTVEREGRRRDVQYVAEERRAVGIGRLAPRAEASPTGVVDPRTPTPAGVVARPPLRFTGSVGNVTVEVRGGQVTVTETDDGRLIIIRTGESEIRIQAPGREGLR